jgi:polyhydroxyalkanoate synthesis regulator phasin
MVDIFTWQERNTKIKELIKEGKTYSEAKKIADEMIKKPQINAKNNKDMEKYMYEKNGLISNKKGDSVDNEK